MRFLCLHGRGTSSDILKAQIDAIRSGLPSDHEFYYVDGEHESNPAEGIAEVFPGPYYSYYTQPTTSDIAVAHELIDEVIEQDGPFDGVIGFSQGAALAASYILRHDSTSTSGDSPFRLAIFICSSLPFSVSEDEGIDITDKFFPSLSMRCVEPSSLFRPKDIFIPGHDTGSSPASFRHSGASTPSSVSSSTYSLPSSSVSSSSVSSPLESGRQTPLSEVSDHENASSISSAEKVRRFHPASPGPRISIATAHIYGKHDQYYPQSLALKELCNSRKRTSFEHEDGHIVPRGTKPTRGMIDAIEKASTLAYT